MPDSVSQKKIFRIFVIAAIHIFLFVACRIPAEAVQSQGGGKDECARCHREEVDSFEITRHAFPGQCSDCHGVAENHLASKGEKNTILNPRNLGIKKSNTICLKCHEEMSKDIGQSFTTVPNLHDQLRCFECHKVHSNSMNTQEDSNLFKEDLSVDCSSCHHKNATDFSNSAHGSAAMTCSDCHKLHETKTISRDIEEQINRCLSCHPTQELEFKAAYVHPLREKQIKCSSCHNPHSNRHEHMLKADDGKTCDECHADINIQGGKHPLSKDTNHSFRRVKCLDCHESHGGNFDKLLKHNIDNLCTTCHK